MSTPLTNYKRPTITVGELRERLSDYPPDTKVWTTETDYDTDVVHYRHLTNVSSNGGFFFGLSEDDYAEQEYSFEDDEIWDDELEDEIEGELA